jgi:DUF3014 family protein
MKTLILWIVIAAVVGGVGAGLYYYNNRAEVPPPEQAASVPPSAAQPSPPRVEPPISYPIPPRNEAAEAKPLPPLNESDPSLRDELAALFGATAFADFFNADDIVRHFVVSVDNLPRKKMAQRQMPVKPVPGRIATSGAGDELVLSPANSARYDALVQVALAVDAKKLVAAYVYFYPLFQQAYIELGYPSGYFNDRLIAAIDTLLATPEIQGPIKLTQPKVLYEFADPDLEALPAGQKAMLRMGSENATKAKAKLREVRAALLAQSKH